MSLRTAARQLNELSQKPATRSPGRLLILPCDPWTLDGSKGDEAMIQGLVNRLRAHQPGLEIGIVVASDQARARASDLGFLPIDAWSCSFEAAVNAMLAFEPEYMVTIGADVMDGYYSPLTTTRLLLLSDALARRGVRTLVSGFSFNAAANTLVRGVFDGLSEQLKLNIRDRTSLDRFRAFTRAPAQLVADAAFLLEPSADFPVMGDVIAWVKSQKNAGRVVLGFNMHPMLIKGASADQLGSLVDAAVTSLRSLLDSRPVSFLLLPHDFRGQDGDDTCLGPIHRALAATAVDRVLYSSSPLAAAQLKALAGLVDGVVTARMHLAIAALSMGRPVAALTYQDKFQGLFAHFGYPERFLLDPQGAADPRRLASMIEDFIDQLPALTTTVVERLPEVRRASALNLTALTA